MLNHKTLLLVCYSLGAAEIYIAFYLRLLSRESYTFLSKDLCVDILLDISFRVYIIFVYTQKRSVWAGWLFRFPRIVVFRKRRICQINPRRPTCPLLPRYLEIIAFLRIYFADFLVQDSENIAVNCVFDMMFFFVLLFTILYHSPVFSG